MKCSQILNLNLDYDPEISHITQDSRDVRKGSLFFCSKTGEQGRAYLRDAKARGAAVCICAEPQEGCLFSENVRRDYALACSRFWGNPEKKLKLIAVTGTNGKSSVAWILQHILQNCGLIGTICNRFGDVEIPAVYTTPDASQLYPLLAQMAAAGCEYVVMEASSQAIVQQRLAGLTFELGIFTNLSRDHLDQHGTMEEYFSVKRSIFTRCKCGLTSADNDFGLILREEDKLTSYSLYSNDKTTSDYWVSELQKNPSESHFYLEKRGEKVPVSLKIPGEFSVSNAVAALAAANMLGVPLPEAATALGSCTGIPGRVQCISVRDFTVIIDYAHTSDGLENVLKMTENLHFKRIFAVFGCAGERDRGDRKAMVEMVLRYAEKAVFTADNPREEPWEQICGDVPQNEHLLRIYDRAEAIEMALGWCGKGDVLLLLGKGHESYQALPGRSVYFSELECLREWQKKQPEY